MGVQVTDAETPHDPARIIIVKILENPEAGLIVRPHLRRFLLARFPYSLLYQATGDRIRILAVMHHRRRPDYWTNRI